LHTNTKVRLRYAPTPPYPIQKVIHSLAYEGQSFGEGLTFVRKVGDKSGKSKKGWGEKMV